MGFEPTTFPVSPGRAHQSLDHCAVFPSLKLVFPSHGGATRGVLFLVYQPPRTVILQGFGVIRVVVGQAFFDVHGLADVVPTRGLTLENVNAERHCGETLVEPMGFEPTTSSMPSRRAPNCATAPPEELLEVYHESVSGWSGGRRRIVGFIACWRHWEQHSGAARQCRFPEHRARVQSLQGLKPNSLHRPCAGAEAQGLPSPMIAEHLMSEPRLRPPNRGVVRKLLGNTVAGFSSRGAAAFR